MSPVVSALSLQLLAILGSFAIWALLPTPGGILIFVYFALVGWAANRLSRCPNCQKSGFEHQRSRYVYWGPFPELTCSRCGTDLTASSEAKRRK